MDVNQKSISFNLSMCFRKYFLVLLVFKQSPYEQIGIHWILKPIEGEIIAVTLLVKWVAPARSHHEQGCQFRFNEMTDKFRTALSSSVCHILYGLLEAAERKFKWSWGTCVTLHIETQTTIAKIHFIEKNVIVNSSLSVSCKYLLIYMGFWQISINYLFLWLQDNFHSQVCNFLAIHAHSSLT